MGSGGADLEHEGDGAVVDEFDAHVAAAGLRVEQRFATWDLRPWAEDSDFAVSVLRKS